MQLWCCFDVVIVCNIDVVFNVVILCSYDAVSGVVIVCSCDVVIICIYSVDVMI